MNLFQRHMQQQIRTTPKTRLPVMNKTVHQQVSAQKTHANVGEALKITIEGVENHLGRHKTMQKSTIIVTCTRKKKNKEHIPLLPPEKKETLKIPLHDPVPKTQNTL